MTAWPAAVEKRQLALLDGSLGLAMLIVAVLTVEGTVAWLVLAAAAAILAILDVWLRRPRRAQFDDITERPEAVVAAATPARTFVQRSLPHLASSLLSAAACLVIFPMAPVLTGFVAILLCSTALDAREQAAAIRRWEQRHSGRLVRTGGFTQPDCFFPIAH